MAYAKQAFDVTSLPQAMNVVLTSEQGKPDKFYNETQFLIDLLAKQNIITNESLVLDFGCGMGRVSKKLIEHFNCNVIGVDISDSMLAFAKVYTNHDRFTTLNSYTSKESIDVCVSTFVLQHTENPLYEIENICNVLKSGGYFVLVNESYRLVPSDIDRNRFVIWNDDKFDVFGEVSSRLKKISSVQYMSTHVDVIIYRKEI
jgi:ubiquinone/menaquinone biosynthesis C-methylase UbiE